MQCKKCDVEVPTQYEFALSQNMCPKCGNKLMHDVAMKMYIDLRKRLDEVEFVMDKTTVCERVAMFMVSNYDVRPLTSSITQKATASVSLDRTEAVTMIKDVLDDTIESSDDTGITAQQIREEEGARAAELAAAREFVNPDIDFDDDMPSLVDEKKVARLKKLARTGQVGVIKRSA